MSSPTETGERPRGLFVPAVLLGNLRLLLGMVRANRPWRFAARLYGALVAAGAVAVYGIVSSDIWRLSAAMDWWRLALASLVAITITVTAIVIVHGLWERPPERRVRDQVVLFNVVTAITLVIGILCLYAALFGLSLAGAALVITPGTLTNAIGHPVGRLRLRLARLVPQLAGDSGRRARRRARVGRGRSRSGLCRAGERGGGGGLSSV